MSLYAAERKPEHSTLGDSYRAIQRDKDAFEAGAQYALDGLLRALDDVAAAIPPTIGGFITGEAARILRRVHDGEPQ